MAVHCNIREGWDSLTTSPCTFGPVKYTQVRRGDLRYMAIGRAWCHMLVIPVLGRLRQEDRRFAASLSSNMVRLSNLARPCFKTKNKKGWGCSLEVECPWVQSPVTHTKIK